MLYEVITVDVLEILLVEQRSLDQAALLEGVLHLGQAVGGEGYLLALLVDLVVAVEGLAFLFLGVLAGVGVLLDLDEVVAEARDLVDLEGISYNFV